MRRGVDGACCRRHESTTICCIHPLLGKMPVMTGGACAQHLDECTATYKYIDGHCHQSQRSELREGRCSFGSDMACANCALSPCSPPLSRSHHAVGSMAQEDGRVINCWHPALEAAMALQAEITCTRGRNMYGYAKHHDSRMDLPSQLHALVFSLHL